MKSLRRVLPSWGQLPMIGSNWSVVILGAFITASLALVVEDFFPRDSDDGRVVPWRMGLLVAAVLLLLVVLGLRAITQDQRGTLFYVQLLDESMPNRHEQPLATARDRRMSMRSLTRWVDLKSRLHGGVIDCVEPSRELSQALEEAINTDRDDTGYSVAPNMFWPIALAVGFSLPHPDSLRMLELQPQNQGTPPKSTPSERKPERSGGSSSRAEIEYPLDTDPVSLVKAEPSVADSQASRVGVWLAFTPQAKHFSAAEFAQFGVGTVHTLTYQGNLPGRNEYEPNFGRGQLERMGPEIAERLAVIKAGAGERELVVVAMVPKSVALALGWHLSQEAPAFFRGTHLMNFDQAERRYVPMRVRESQPTTPPLPQPPPQAESAPQAPSPTQPAPEATSVAVNGNGHGKEADGAGDDTADA
ncbi:hypothetical protein ACOQFL_18720 [Actinopolyspora sp. H202]|uniref:hypothetical protein n=1 Tax=Actinopolyspora sp. H202 TaxID=1500456 RepID=UPI003EE76459